MWRMSIHGWLCAGAKNVRVPEFLPTYGLLIFADKDILRLSDARPDGLRNVNATRVGDMPFDLITRIILAAHLDIEYSLAGLSEQVDGVIVPFPTFQLSRLFRTIAAGRPGVP